VHKPARDLSPLRHLDVAEVSRSASKEARNRETHLPPVSVYRWWARRTMAVNDAVLEAIERDAGGSLTVLDPFAGGGVIPIVAAMRGHRVLAQEIDPWAIHGLRALAGLGDVGALSEAAATLEEAAAPELRDAYATRFANGEPAQVAHTFRVAVSSCAGCGVEMKLFPHALVSRTRRKERGGDEAWLACARGHLHLGDGGAACDCPTCGERIEPRASHLRGRVATCVSCGARQRLSALAGDGGLRWRTVLVERAGDGRRELALARDSEVEQADGARWQPQRSLGEIPDGRETRVLLRHGFRALEDLYPRRQRVVLEAMLAACEGLDVEEDTRGALRLALVGTTEMAGLLSRWDRYYLKSYEAMAGHRFNLTTLPVEPHVRGCDEAGRGTFRRRVRQLQRAARWWRENVDGAPPIQVFAGSSERVPVPDASVDVVLTDPPYHDDVQYSQLSLPLRAWAGLPLEMPDDGAVAESRAAEGYAEALTRIFREVRRTLKPDGRLIFSYANREPEAWMQLLDALEQAGFAGAGFRVVHSENERDAAKRGVRSCRLDVLLDLVPAPTSSQQASPGAERMPVDADEEAAFCQAIGAWVLRVGALPEGWRETLVAELRAQPFLRRETPAA